MDSRQPAWFEPGQFTGTMLFRTIAKREDQQQARLCDESRRKSDFRFQIWVVYAVEAAVSAAE